MLDVEVHVQPLAEVVTQPMTRPLPRAWESRATDDERTLARIYRLQCQVRGFLLHHTPEVMRMQFDESAGVSGIRCERLDPERTVTCCTQVRWMSIVDKQ